MSGRQDGAEAKPGAAPDAGPDPGTQAPADPQAAIAETSPTGLQVPDAWEDAADRTGTVEARRDMPEPDSLGG